MPTPDPPPLPDPTPPPPSEPSPSPPAPPPIDLIRQFLACRAVPCPHCNYDLRDAREPRCPECGMALVLTLAGQARIKRAWLPALCLALISASTGLVSWALWRAWEGLPKEPVFVVYFSLFGGIALAGAYATIHATRAWRSASEVGVVRALSRATVLAGLIALLFLSAVGPKFLE